MSPLLDQISGQQRTFVEINSALHSHASGSAGAGSGAFASVDRLRVTCGSGLYAALQIVPRHVTSDDLLSIVVVVDGGRGMREGVRACRVVCRRRRSRGEHCNHRPPLVCARPPPPPRPSPPSTRMGRLVGRLFVGFTLFLITFIGYSSQIFVIWPWYGRELSVELLSLLLPFK